MSWGELFAFLMFVLELLKFFWRILCSVIRFMSKKRSNRYFRPRRLLLFFLFTRSMIDRKNLRSAMTSMQKAKKSAHVIIAITPFP